MHNGIWSDKLSNVFQVGGIETSILDNGPGRGLRVAWVNTGTGLRYKVVIDRAMDISQAFYNQYGLAWLSHSGSTPPEPLASKGVDWLQGFGGGLITTCGLSHVGGPEKDEFGERGLHGIISNMPATIESIIQPDPANGKFDMSITGIIKEARVFGPSLEMRRTISGTLGKAGIHLCDEVVNRGNMPVPHMLLYHCNFGWPLVDEGAEIFWKGQWSPRHPDKNPMIFTAKNNFHKCPPVMKEHNGAGEEVGIIDIDADDKGMSICGIYNEKLGIAVIMRFPKKQLPWLTNWQHWGKGEYVTALEPGTHPPIGQAAARAKKTLIFLEPGESRTYNLVFEVIGDETGIQKLMTEGMIADYSI